VEIKVHESVPEHNGNKKSSGLVTQNENSDVVRFFKPSDSRAMVWGDSNLFLLEKRKKLKKQHLFFFKTNIQK
jgi:hypothetical protein